MLRIGFLIFIVFGIFACQTESQEERISRKLSDYIYAEIPIDAEYLEWNLDTLIHTAGQTPDAYEKVKLSRAAGIRLLNANRNEEAKFALITVRNIVRRMISLEAELPEAQHLLGLAYLKSGSKRKIINSKNYNKALSKTSDLEDKRIIEKAHKIYSELLEQFPENEKYKYLLGYLSFNLGENNSDFK